MENSENPTEKSPVAKPKGDGLQRYGGHRWIPFVLPLLVYMLSGQFEPRPADVESAPDAASVAAEDGVKQTDAGGEDGFTDYVSYPLVYSLRIALTVGVMVIAIPAYRSFPFRVSGWAIVAGIVGVGLWIWLCSLGLEGRFLPDAAKSFLGLDKTRAAYNPLEQLEDQPLRLTGFLAIRFLGLALVVPVTGVQTCALPIYPGRRSGRPDWWTLPIGATGAAARIAIIAYAALSHPGEMVAAMVWFSLITALVMYTKNIWDAVTAHAVTNLLLGIYVLTTGNWQSW